MEKTIKPLKKKSEYEVMMRKKLNMIEHRKRRKKKLNGKEKIKSGKDDDELNTRKRKKKSVKMIRIIVIAFLVSTAKCQGVTVPPHLCVGAEPEIEVNVRKTVSGDNIENDISTRISDLTLLERLRKKLPRKHGNLHIFYLQ